MPNAIGNALRGLNMAATRAAQAVNKIANAFSQKPFSSTGAAGTAPNTSPSGTAQTTAGGVQNQISSVSNSAVAVQTGTFNGVNGVNSGQTASSFPQPEPSANAGENSLISGILELKLAEQAYAINAKAIKLIDETEKKAINTLA